MLGDQLTLITLPWLALYLSPEPWVLGSVLAVLAIPMSVFMLLGGAIVDRFSSKKVLLVTKYCNTVLMLALAILLLNNALSLALLYLIVFFIGCCSAFAIPAGSALLPQVVHAAQLPMANSVGMTLRSLTSLIGPLLAAVLLGIESATLAQEEANTVSQQGLAYIFMIDAVSFAFSALLLRFIPVASASKPSKGVASGLSEGFQYFWSNNELRQLVLYIALVTSFLGGMMQVGLPLLVSAEWQTGAHVFGYLMAMMAAGNILGMFIAARFSSGICLTLGQTILLADMAVGVLLMLMSQLPFHWYSFGILMILGLVAGYVQVIFISWVQQQASREMLGRLMSIVMFGVVGLLPLSTSLTGVFLQFFSVASFFLYCGAALIVIALMALRFSAITAIANVIPNGERLSTT